MVEVPRWLSLFFFFFQLRATVGIHLRESQSFFFLSERKGASACGDDSNISHFLPSFSDELPSALSGKGAA